MSDRKTRMSVASQRTPYVREWGFSGHAAQIEELLSTATEDLFVRDLFNAAKIYPYFPKTEDGEYVRGANSMRLVLEFPDQTIVVGPMDGLVKGEIHHQDVLNDPRNKIYFWEDWSLVNLPFMYFSYESDIPSHLVDNYRGSVEPMTEEETDKIVEAIPQLGR